MKTGIEATDTDENKSGSVKHVNGTRRPRYRRKWVWKRKTGIGALSIAENESESTKHENVDYFAFGHRVDEYKGLLICRSFLNQGHPQRLCPSTKPLNELT
jgi:hypothetical protein